MVPTDLNLIVDGDLKAIVDKVGDQLSASEPLTPPSAPKALSSRLLRTAAIVAQCLTMTYVKINLACMKVIDIFLGCTD